MTAQLRLDAMFAAARERGADEAELDAPLGKMQRFAAPEKRCTHIIDGHGTRCKWWFPESDEHDWCKTCRFKHKKWKDEHKEQIAESAAVYREEHKEQIKAYNDVWNNSDAGRESKAIYRDQNKDKIAESAAIYREQNKDKIAESGAIYRAEHKEQIAESDAVYRAEHKEQIKAYNDVWNNSDAGRESKATWRDQNKEQIAESDAIYKKSSAGVAARARYRASNACKLANARYKEKHAVKLKEKQDEWNHSPMGLLCRALYKMVTGTHWNPQSFPALGSFQSNEEAREHFQSQFEPWMSWENRGAHEKNNEYNQVWNIGHWLPRAIFDPTSHRDLRKCWHPDNLFPQCAKANTEYRDVLIYTDDELLAKRHLWPDAANDDLDQLKGLFRFTAL